jgi:D-alanyl-D-alanine carboxypeptidase
MKKHQILQSAFSNQIVVSSENPTVKKSRSVVIIYKFLIITTICFLILFIFAGYISSTKQNIQSNSFEFISSKSAITPVAQNKQVLGLIQRLREDYTNTLLLSKNGKVILQKLSDYETNAKNNNYVTKLSRDDLVMKLRSDIGTELVNLGIVDTSNIDTYLGLRHFDDERYSKFLDDLDFKRFDELHKGSAASETIILGDSIVDKKIRQIASSRGFSPHDDIKDSELTAIEDVTIDKVTASKYNEMKQSAASLNIKFIISSGYRSVDDQRIIFTGECIAVIAKRIGSYIAVDQIAKIITEDDIKTVMNRVAPPGYSRHHSGHTIDINDAVYITAFDQTPAYKWLSNNNYLNARKFGFMPSYPKLSVVTQFGPNPEAWEYVYVGNDLLEFSWRLENS